MAQRSPATQAATHNFKTSPDSSLWHRRSGACFSHLAFAAFAASRFVCVNDMREKILGQCSGTSATQHEVPRDCEKSADAAGFQWFPTPGITFARWSVSSASVRTDAAAVRDRGRVPQRWALQRRERAEFAAPSSTVMHAAPLTRNCYRRTALRHHNPDKMQDGNFDSVRRGPLDRARPAAGTERRGLRIPFAAAVAA